jgi:ubiquinone/menaquinone biosynthesis C-methylase UbiE
MGLNNTWGSKSIIKHIGDTRANFNQLYKGEKYLISKFIKNNDTVLDIGCGQGGLCHILNKKFKKIKYTGIDFNKKMIDLAKSNFSDGKFYYFKKKNYYKFFKKKFDVVIIFGILHLNSNWDKILLNASKVSKRAIIFDHRIELKINNNKNFYLDLDFENRNKKFRINYFLLKKNYLENFIKFKMKKLNVNKFYYTGYASKYSNIKNKITFANVGLYK